MKSFISFNSFFSEEIKYRRKGWVNVNGKMVLAAFRGRSIRPYHDEMVAKNPTKFAPGKTIEKRFAELYGFQLGDEESDSMWNDIKSGEVDRDSTLDGIMNSLGWFRVVFDEAICSIETNNKMQAQKVAAVVNRKLDFDKQIGWIQIYERGSLDRDPVTITNADDFETYARTGRVPQRTKIGATMAMFRGESVNEEMDPREHVKKKGDKYVVVAKSGKISAEFDNKKDAEDYAVKNHKNIMKEKYQFMLPDFPEQIPAGEDEGEWAMGDPAVPIKWTGDHKKMYKDVMKHRKKMNPKYKEPEKTMLEGWSEKYKRRIDCSNPRGFSQRAHCAGRKKRTYEDVGGVKYGFSDYFTLQVRR